MIITRNRVCGQCAFGRASALFKLPQIILKH
nr:MAG TPA: NADH-ubiquinone oxidoreductase [Caudoviricetes sp.]